MELTREKALELHRLMWSDMQQELGNYAMGGDRVLYKSEWCQLHFPNEKIANDCFLCEYALKNKKRNCNICPIKWTTENNKDATVYCCYDNYYYCAPISELLALPERELEEEN